MTATLPSDVDRLEAHEIPAEYSQKRMRDFVEKTRRAQGAELANAQTAFNLLCEALQVTAPSLKKAGKAKAAGAAKWPADLPGQIGAVLAAAEDASAEALAEGFSGATTEGVAMVLECLQVAQRVAKVVEDDGAERWVLRA